MQRCDLVWCDEVKYEPICKKRNAAFSFESYRKFWQFQTVCSKVFSGNGWAMLKSDSPVRPMRPAQRKKRAVGGCGGGNYEFYSHGEKEEVGNLKLRATSKMIPRCSSEVSWRAEVFSVISSARLGWDDMSWVCNIQFRNTTIYCTISDWWRSVQNCFEDFSLSTCEHAEFYNVLSRYCSPNGRSQQPRPSREALSSSNGCSLLFLDPCRYCSVREMPW